MDVLLFKCLYKKINEKHSSLSQQSHLVSKKEDLLLISGTNVLIKKLNQIIGLLEWD